MKAKHYDTIVIGGGQAGLAVGYFLAKHGKSFVILDAHQRIGDAWRKRWDSLRLFTPVSLNGLPGMRYPAPSHYFPTKDEMADYLEAYAARFELPVRTGIKVNHVRRNGTSFQVRSGETSFTADNVVVAMANYQISKRPAFASDIDSDILQMDSKNYRNTGQLREGSVLVVGAGNSGAEIALETAKTHRTFLSGRDNGAIPLRIDGFIAQKLFFPVILPFIGKILLTVDTPVGRKMRPKFLSKGDPLFRVKPKDLAGAGVERVPKIVGVQRGIPMSEDGRKFKVGSIIWAIGFHPDFSWIDLPVFEGGTNYPQPRHYRGIAKDEPGLYFVGLKFLYSQASSVVAGVGRDAKYVVDAIAARNSGAA
ncbi:MAG: flavin-containing monooxygenase [Anaerolineales bacterium]